MINRKRKCNFIKYSPNFHTKTHDVVKMCEIVKLEQWQKSLNKERAHFMNYRKKRTDVEFPYLKRHQMYNVHTRTDNRISVMSSFELLSWSHH